MSNASVGVLAGDEDQDRGRQGPGGEGARGRESNAQLPTMRLLSDQGSYHIVNEQARPQERTDRYGIKSGPRPGNELKIG